MLKKEINKKEDGSEGIGDKKRDIEMMNGELKDRIDTVKGMVNLVDSKIGLLDNKIELLGFKFDIIYDKVDKLDERFNTRKEN
ncbi:hypothetical protein RhiirA4_536968 [Rhizophagus irregularis]|uniref:Uncharacterized protein n=1 Tax=Rhizophagus irregularis TaxID=588596 RepID=A0A2I1FUJ6_9GLOM|nr:hypothetical protein RhiirA4_536968 [Rhizophagus irregularis]